MKQRWTDLFEKSLTVWIFQTGEPIHIDSGNVRPMRAMNLCHTLVDSGHKVVLWSSAFNHQEKRQRSATAESIKISDSLEIRLIPSRGYRGNISLGRLIDHTQLALNLKSMLKRVTSLPDVAFIGFPPIEPAAVLTRWLYRCGVPSLIDVKDQWPLIFIDAMPLLLRPLGRVVLFPYFYLARRAMRDAKGISAMADGFLDWALNFAGHKRTGADGVFPLTSQLGQVSEAELMSARQWWNDQGVLDNGTMRICYVGNHTSHLDMLPVRNAASLFIEHKIPVEFVIAGDGVSTLELKAMMSGLSNVYFPGFIDRPKFTVLAERAHASMIPYVNGESFKLSLPNKTFDSLAFGLPILSPLQGEVARLINDHGVGMRYGTDTGKTLYDCIKVLMEDAELQKKMSQNAQALYEERFSFEMVYGGLVKHLEKLANKL